MTEEPAENETRRNPERYKRSTRTYDNKSDGDERSENFKRKSRARTEKQKERHRDLMREYEQRMSFEKKEHRRRKQSEYQKNLSPKKKEERRRKHREYLRNLSPGRKEEARQRRRENRKRNIRTEESTARSSNYSKKIILEQERDRDRLIHEHPEKRTIDKNERVEKTIEDSSRVVQPQMFCYKCRVQFLNNSALLEHIGLHITSPSVTVSRINAHSTTSHIEKEGHDLQINSALSSDISQNVLRVAEECIEHDENVYEFDDTYVNTKIETEIDIDDVSFYIRMKKEMEYTE